MSLRAILLPPVVAAVQIIVWTVGALDRWVLNAPEQDDRSDD